MGVCIACEKDHQNKVEEDRLKQTTCASRNAMRREVIAQYQAQIDKCNKRIAEQQALMEPEE
jgi:peptidoglycan hydrolase CwlO-like protein